ncbi:GH10653 [Drosophila grimshawi]|uniref:GH10653 n=1 Tax=Drosophila grimshawi TaxID=7222 RepID=B4JCJ1_DROGR|nr:GH10653 [Drosophila grimshawi]
MSLLTTVRLFSTTLLLFMLLLPVATLLRSQQQEQQQQPYARHRRENHADQKFSLPAVPLPPPPPFPAAKHNFALNAFAIGEHAVGSSSSYSSISSPGSSSSSSSSGCGGLFNSRYGLIQTPNFPHRFATPIECVWIIDASELPAAQGNISIVVYLTQLYVLGGLKFTEYMYYSDDFKVPAHRVFALNEDDVTQVTWLQFNSQYLEIRFTMSTLDGTHLRALDRLLDVYGFNITYEVTHEVKTTQCNTLQCRFLGDCYASADYR